MRRMSWMRSATPSTWSTGRPGRPAGTVRLRPGSGLGRPRGPRRAGLGVLSEESGLRRPDAALIAVIDPVDGSTNASRGIPWYACSICVLDGDGPLVSLVANLVSGVRYTGDPGERFLARRECLQPSVCDELGKAIVALSGYPRSGWAGRSTGRSALLRSTCARWPKG